MKKNNKKLKNIVLGTLVAGLTLAPITTKAGAFNGTSSSTGATKSSGSGNYVSINDLDIGSQGLSFSLYFLKMPSEYWGNDVEHMEMRNEYWTTGFKSAEQLGPAGGREVLVSRDGFKSSGNGLNGAYVGDIASTLGGGGTYAPAAIATNDKLISVNCSDIGIDSETFPVAVDSLNGKSISPGLDSFSYFMDFNSNYVPGETPLAFTNENMKNLLRFIAGVDPETGLANLSFKDDPDVLEVGGITYRKNNSSVFENGTYKNQSGEFRLFIEPYLVANGVAYTARELCTDAASYTDISKTILYSVKPSFGNALGNFFLTNNDAFGLEAASGNPLSSWSTTQMRDEFALNK